jgi:hypothetical protein
VTASSRSVPNSCSWTLTWPAVSAGRRASTQQRPDQASAHGRGADG